MSDPVSNSDIEDVLSSIRRLVSEEPVTARRATQQKATVERFVLTPALRVGEGEDLPPDDDVDQAEADTSQAEAQTNPPEHGDTHGHRQLRNHRDDAAERDASVDGGQADRMPEDGEDAQAQAEPQDQPEYSDHDEDANRAEQSEHADQGHHPVRHDQSDQPENTEFPDPEDGADQSEDADQPTVAEFAHQAAPELGDAAAEHSFTPQIPEAFESDGEWSEKGKPDTKASGDDNQPTQDEPAQDDHAEPSPTVLDLSFESRIAELEAAIEQGPQDWEPDGSEAEQTDETRPLSADAADTQDSLSNVLAAVEEEPDDDTSRDAPQPDQSLHDTLRALPEHPETMREGTATGEPAASPEPAREDSQDQADDPMPDLGSFFHTDEDDDGQDDTPDTARSAPTQDEPARNPQDMSDEDTELTEAAGSATEWDDAEPEASVAAQAAEPDHPEPEEAEVDEEEAEALRGWESSPIQDALTEDPAEQKDAHDAELVRAHWAAQDDAQDHAQDHAQESTAEDDAPEEAAARHTEEPENMLADDEAMLDEETLREMVSEIVREELQGVLGERITRNVRRLVRREIQRALTMRDLE